MIYCFKCPECNTAVETSERESALACPNCSRMPMVRDYKAEGARVDRFALKTWGTRHARRDPEGDGTVTYV